MKNSGTDQQLRNKNVLVGIVRREMSIGIGGYLMFHFSQSTSSEISQTTI